MRRKRRSMRPGGGSRSSSMTRLPIFDPPPTTTKKKNAAQMQAEESSAARTEAERTTASPTAPSAEAGAAAEDAMLPTSADAPDVTAAEEPAESAASRTTSSAEAAAAAEDLSLPTDADAPDVTAAETERAVSPTTAAAADGTYESFSSRPSRYTTLGEMNLSTLCTKVHKIRGRLARRVALERSAKPGAHTYVTTYDLKKKRTNRWVIGIDVVLAHDHAVGATRTSDLFELLEPSTGKTMLFTRAKTEEKVEFEAFVAALAVTARQNATAHHAIHLAKIDEGTSSAPPGDAGDDAASTSSGGATMGVAPTVATLAADDDDAASTGDDTAASAAAPSGPSTTPSSSDGDFIQPDACEGWLYKAGAKKGSALKKRWCVVRKGKKSLIYFAKKPRGVTTNGRNKKGEISLDKIASLIEGHHGRFLVVTSSGRTYDFHTLLPKQASHIHFITSQLWLRCLEAESGVAPRGNPNSPCGFNTSTLSPVVAAAAAEGRRRSTAALEKQLIAAGGDGIEEGEDGEGEDEEEEDEDEEEAITHGRASTFIRDADAECDAAEDAASQDGETADAVQRGDEANPDEERGAEASSAVSEVDPTEVVKIKTEGAAASEDETGGAGEAQSTLTAEQETKAQRKAKLLAKCQAADPETSKSADATINGSLGRGTAEKEEVDGGASDVPPPPHLLAAPSPPPPATVDETEIASAEAPDTSLLSPPPPPPPAEAEEESADPGTSTRDDMTGAADGAASDPPPPPPPPSTDEIASADTSPPPPPEKEDPPPPPAAAEEHLLPPPPAAEQDLPPPPPADSANTDEEKDENSAATRSSLLSVTSMAVMRPDTLVDELDVQPAKRKSSVLMMASGIEHGAFAGNALAAASMFEARSRLSSSDVLIDASAAEEADEEDDEKGPAAPPVALAVAQAGDVETAVLTGLDTRTHRLATVPEAAVAATLPPAGERRPSLLPAFVFGAAPPAPRNYLSERRESEAIVQAVKRNSTLASTPSVKAMRPKAIAAVKVAAAAHHATIIAGRAAALNMKERKQSAAAAAESGDLSDDVDDDV